MEDESKVKQLPSFTTGEYLVLGDELFDFEDIEEPEEQKIEPKKHRRFKTPNIHNLVKMSFKRKN